MHDVKNTRRNIIIYSVLAIGIMFVVDAIIQPGFWIKSLIKVFFFLVMPIFLFKDRRHLNIKQMLKPTSMKQLLISLILGMTIFGVIVLAYFLLDGYINLELIQEKLGTNFNVNADNFIYIAIYISFFNSLLEEFFFRGLLFLGLRNLGMKAYGLSAFLFAIYHVAIIGGWFSWEIYLLAMLGLFAGGLIFNFIDKWVGNIYHSWLVHACANLAINYVGMIMFGLL